MSLDNLQQSPSSSTNSIDISVGPILPSAEISVTLPQPSLYQRISNSYKNAIKRFVAYLTRHKWEVTVMVLGTLLIEPWQAIKAGLMCPAGWKKHFNYYGMNPLVLTEEQSTKEPILLLHGNLHNQSAWISLAKKLQGSNLGPVYTVNLPNGNITDKDYEIIQTKIEQIKSQYRQYNVNNIKINVIGHSRGGDVASYAAWDKKENGKRYWHRSDDFGKVIKIGSLLNQEKMKNIEQVDPDFRSRVCEITGKYDVLETRQSLLLANQNKIVPTGHLELLYSSATHQHIIDCLSS